MTDLHTRFKTLDSVSAPDLWYSIEERAMAMRPTRQRSSAWILIAVTLLVVLAIGGAVLVGSGIIKLPAVVDASASPSSANPPPSALESSAATSSPVQPVPASWGVAGDMVEPRSNHTATRLLDGRVLVAGGIGTQISEGVANILSSAELYDPATGAWTATGDMLEIRGAHTAVLLPDGKVLVVGGSACSDFDGCPLFSAELYDPTTGTWIATQPTTAGGPARTATLLTDGTVLVVGGSVGSLSQDTLEPIGVAELYDPRTGQWSATGPLVQPLESHTATELLDGRVLVVGGSTAAQLYDPTTRRWTATVAMEGVRVGHTAALLPNGQVLIAGGMAGTGALTLAELYDPATGQWISTGDMVEGRIYHTATSLADGRVLVMDGVDSVIEGVAVTTAELYDPGTGQWTSTVNMAVTRLGFSATLLGDGTVLVAGGGDRAGSVFAAAELYYPGSGT